MRKSRRSSGGVQRQSRSMARAPRLTSDEYGGTFPLDAIRLVPAYRHTAKVAVSVSSKEHKVFGYQG